MSRDIDQDLRWGSERRSLIANTHPKTGGGENKNYRKEERNTDFCLFCIREGEIRVRFARNIPPIWRSSRATLGARRCGSHKILKMHSYNEIVGTNVTLG